MTHGRLGNLAALAAAIALLPGCATWGYDQIQVGGKWTDARRALPLAELRRGGTSAVHVAEPLLGDARTTVVVLLTTAERVAAKFEIVQRRGDARGPFASATPGYRLRAEVDPVAVTLEHTGLLDALRVLADDLILKADNAQMRTAQKRVSAGLVRIIQRWPTDVDEGPALEQLTDVLDSAPAGGDATLGIRANGRLEFTYQTP